MPPSRESASITPRDNSGSYSVISAGSCAAGLQIVVSRRQPIQRVVLSATGDESAPARSPFVHAMICAASLFFCSAAPFDGSVHAEPVAIAGTATPPPALPFAAFVAEASRRFDIPANWIWAVMRIESGGRATAISPKGAMGLMQIMPKTYAGLRARYHLGANPYDPRDNIPAGAAYLREMHDRYGSPGFLAAYNAGPARYDEHLATGRALPIETQDYVAMLTPMIDGLRAENAPTPPFDLFVRLRSTLFVPHENGAPVAVDAPLNASPERPPTIRRVVDLSALAPHSDGLFVRIDDRTQSQ